MNPTLHHGLSWLADTPVARFFSDGHHLLGAALQVVHIVGFVLLLAALLLTVLRRLGVWFGDLPATAVLHHAGRLFWLGLVLASVSGVLMFVASPLLYAVKPVFQLKLLLIALGLVAYTWWSRPGVPASTDGPARGTAHVLRLGGTLFVWLLAAASGRAIGFL